MISAGVGFALLCGSVIPREFGRAALVVAVLFVVAGIAACLGQPGLVLAIIMSIVEAVWILAAAIALGRVAWR